MACKLAVVGPPGAGKTVLCKAAAEQTLGVVPGRGAYSPTVGCRVQEVARTVNGTSLSMQLWDCAGDESAFYRLASVFGVHATGLVLVYDGRKGGESASTLESMMDAVTSQVNLPLSQIVCVAVFVGRDSAGEAPPIPGKLGQLQHCTVHVDPNGSPYDDVQPFLQVLDTIVNNAMRTRRETEASHTVATSEF